MQLGGLSCTTQSELWWLMRLQLYVWRSLTSTTPNMGFGDVEKSENQHEVKDVNENGEHEGLYTIKATAGEDDEGASLRSIVTISCVTPNFF